MKKGVLVSFEGISGCGKSFLLEKLRQQHPEYYYLQELSERKNGDFITHSQMMFLTT